MSSTQQAPRNHKSHTSSPDGTGFAHEQITDIQRARILSATVDVVAERGAASATVAHVVARSGVSRRTFYEIFTDRDDCFLAAFDDAVALASSYVKDAYDPREKWVIRIRAALIALLRFLEDQPLMGRLLIVESLAAGPHGLARRSQTLARIIPVVSEGSREASAGEGRSPLVAEGTVGAVLSILHARFAENSSAALVELTNPLMSMIALPYLGVAASRRELARPVPEHDGAGASPRGASDPLRELGMRLTYRTVRALNAIAASPGSSNRSVAEHAGIADQGQTSKLLRRLESFGLIETTGNGAEYGEPNAWTLTPHGESVIHMIG